MPDSSYDPQQVLFQLSGAILGCINTQNSITYNPLANVDNGACQPSCNDTSAAILATDINTFGQLLINQLDNEQLACLESFGYYTPPSPNTGVDVGGIYDDLFGEGGIDVGGVDETQPTFDITDCPDCNCDCPDPCPDVNTGGGGNPNNPYGCQDCVNVQPTDPCFYYCWSNGLIVQSIQGSGTGGFVKPNPANTFKPTRPSKTRSSRFNGRKRR